MPCERDRDGDGVPDCDDECPDDASKAVPGRCGCASPDADHDGTPDCDDGCPADGDKVAPGGCGCGVSDADSDHDGAPDCEDDCPDSDIKADPGICGCDTHDIDTDGDGSPACEDACPADVNKTAPGACGCGRRDTDIDGDGTLDCNDACPGDPERATAPCRCDTDTDGDGTADCDDLCPGNPIKVDPGVCGCSAPDSDRDDDGTPDCADACPEDGSKAANPGLCGCGSPETDTDRDGVPDCIDDCPHDSDKIRSGVCGCGRQAHGSPLDVLFVVDNGLRCLGLAPGMPCPLARSQQALAAQLPDMLRRLAAGDIEGDGVRDFLPPESVHLGAVSTDMGARGLNPRTCGDEPDFGDDGILRSASHPSSPAPEPGGVPGCSPTNPPFLTFRPGAAPSLASVAMELGCTLRMGAQGCQYPMPLDAMLKALVSGRSPLRFYPDTIGHGDGANAGFLRDDSALAVVVLSSERDCSAAEPELFSSMYRGHPCVDSPEALHPVERYVDGLVAQRRGRADQIAFAVIGGVPSALVDDVGPQAFEQMLAADALQHRVDPEGLGEYLPSCTTPAGPAYPPRRLLRTAQGVSRAGGHARATSICRSDLGPALAPILDAIGRSITTRCE